MSTTRSAVLAWEAATQNMINMTNIIAKAVSEAMLDVVKAEWLKSMRSWHKAKSAVRPVVFTARTHPKLAQHPNLTE